MSTFQPPPIGDPFGSYRWVEWFRKLTGIFSAAGTVPWANVDKAGSNITDIATRAHNNLQSVQGGTTSEYYHLTAAQHSALTAGPHNALAGLQGGTSGEYYHLTSAQHTDLTDGGESTAHYHDADRNRGNHTGRLACESYTVATLPAATTAAQIIYVSNEAGGAVLAFSDGTNWRRVTDRAIVS